MEARGDALEWAMALAKAPAERVLLRQRSLPAGMERLLQVAAGSSSETLAEFASQTGENETDILEAARFYAREILFHQGADAYRVLGVAHDADTDTIRTHHRLLQLWLHPDRHSSDWDAIFASRVNSAWSRLRSDDRRQAYDKANPPQGRDEAPLNSISPTWMPPKVEGVAVEVDRWRRRAPVLALFAVCVLLAVLAIRDLQKEPVGVLGELGEVANTQPDASNNPVGGPVTLHMPDAPAARTSQGVVKPIAPAQRVADMAAIKPSLKPLVVAVPVKKVVEPATVAIAAKPVVKQVAVAVAAKPVVNLGAETVAVKSVQKPNAVAAAANHELKPVTVAAKPVPKQAAVIVAAKPVPKEAAVIVAAKPALKPIAVAVAAKPAHQPVAVAVTAQSVPNSIAVNVPVKLQQKPTVVAGVKKLAPESTVATTKPTLERNAITAPVKTAPRPAPTADVPVQQVSASNAAAADKPVALSSTRPASLANDLPAVSEKHMQDVQKVGGQLIAYLSKTGASIPPIWGSLATQRGAAQLRDDLLGKGSLKVDSPNWRVGDKLASMRANIRYRDGSVGRLAADLVWRDQRWLVSGLSVERDL